MASLPGFLLRHTATVEPYQGAGSFGDLYGPPEVLRCFAEDKRRMVRSGAGEQVVSEVTCYFRRDATIPVGSRVTVNGRAGTALAVTVRDGGGLPTPDHVEVALT